MEVRGRIEAAGLKAERLGGDSAKYLYDPDVTKYALKFRQEQLYMNPNAAASIATGATQNAPGYIKSIAATLLPFNKVPANLAMRGLEYTGAGAVLGPARAAGVRLTGKDFAAPGRAVAPATMTADEQAAAMTDFRRSAALQTGRGLAGLGLGLGGGYLATKGGLLTPPNEKEHEYGRVNLGRYSFDTSRLEPVMTAPDFGGEIYNKTHGGSYDLAAPLTTSPYFRLGDTLMGAKEAGSGKTGSAERAGGQILSAYIPTLLSQIASYTDPSGETRKKAALQDYLMARVPGLREKLEKTGRTQPTNIKTTPAIGLLSPVAVEPRRPAPVAGAKPGASKSGASPFGGAGGGSRTKSPF